MLKVKADKFSFQGNGEAHFLKQGDIVAEEIFLKEYPGLGGVDFLNSVLNEGLLEGKIEWTPKLEAELDKRKKEFERTHKKPFIDDSISSKISGKSKDSESEDEEDDKPKKGGKKK